MALILHNSLTKRKEVFTPSDSGLVKMYVCGPTVYDYPHLGNARSFVIYDILYRILRKIYGHDHVLYVRNITDIDDKIIIRAARRAISIAELTKETTGYFHEATDYLNCLKPGIEPKATRHIADIIAIIELLLARNIAYQVGGCIYFDITKYPDYTHLSGQSLADMSANVRIEYNPNKKNAGDFILWKKAGYGTGYRTDYRTGHDAGHGVGYSAASNMQNNAAIDQEGLADTEDIARMELSEQFDSPFGKGRPGWHIECSAMSYKYLGENFDIHGGGADLIFPHHTNEIAQSRSAFPGSSFAHFWVHNGFLTVDGEKMSKSLNNFITPDDLMKQKIEGRVVRMFLLSNHYRKPLDYNIKAINDAAKMLSYWQRASENLPKEHLPKEQITDNNDELPAEFMNSLFEDMNTPLAIKLINDYAKSIYVTTDLKTKISLVRKMLSCAGFLGLMEQNNNPIQNNPVQQTIEVRVIEELIARRNVAKKQQNWLEADGIRNDLAKQGIILADNSDGSCSWRHNINYLKNAKTKNDKK